jgi:hypothetical protein
MSDHPWIILLVAAAGLLRWLLQKKGDATKQDSERPTAPPAPISRAEPQTEEERIRRFLEALGQPAGTRPPPKVTPRRAAQPRVFPSLPPLTSTPPPLPSTPPPAARATAPPPIKERIFKPATVQELGFEVRDIGAQISSDLPMESRRATVEQPGFLARLASREGLRSAIILREIFGPPRSLQPPDPINGF